MKSFKKTALGLVAALTLGTIVATPASASAMTLVVEKGSGTNASPTWTGVTAASTPNGLSATSAISLTVPSDNSVDAADVVKFTATVVAGTSVSVTSANAVLLSAHATTTAPVTSTSGSATLSLPTVASAGTTTANAVFYVYTKTTAIGTVTVSNGANSATYYVQGAAGGVSSISVTGVDTAAAGTQNTYTVVATDVFGNKVTGVELSATIANGTVEASVAGTVTGSGLTDFGSKDYKVTVPASGTTTVIFAVNTTAMAAATPVKPVQSAITGFVTPVLTAAKAIAVRDLAAELAAEKAARAADKTASDKALADAKAAADAELAKAKADLAKATTDLAKANSDIAKLTADAVIAKANSDKAIASLKKAFNALARKWNAKNPTAKVTLVK